MTSKDQFWKTVNSTIRSAQPKSIILINEPAHQVVNLGNDERLIRSALEQLRYDAYSRSAPPGGGLFEEIQMGPVRSTRSRPIKKKQNRTVFKLNDFAPRLEKRKAKKRKAK